MNGIYKEAAAYMKVLSTRRLTNICILFFGYYLSRFVRRPLPMGLPFAVSMEPTTVCNLHCPECPTGNGTLGRSKGTMSLSQFEHFVQKLPPETFHLNLYLQGEPFLNPHLIDFIRLVTKKNLFTVISTNAQIMDEALANKLIDAGLSKIIISLDGLSQATYAAYRIGGSIDAIKATLGHLQNAKQKRKSSLPIVEIQTIVFRHNEHELPLIKQFAKQYGVDVVKTKRAQFYDNPSSLVQPPLEEKLSRYKKGGNGLTVKGHPYNHCIKSSTSMVAAWNGDVSPCCMDKDMKHKVGSLVSSSWQQVWHGKELNAFRLSVLKNRAVIDMCANCPEGRGWWL